MGTESIIRPMATTLHKSVGVFESIYFVSTLCHSQAAFRFEEGLFV